jgi:WD40 repeat protein
VLASWGWDNTVRLWDVEAGAPLVGAIEHHALGGFGEQMLTIVDGQLGVWQHEPGDELLTLTAPTRLGVRAALAMDAGASLIATCGAEGALVWDLSRGGAMTSVVEDETLSVHLADGGRRLLTLHNDGLRSWTLVRAGGRLAAVAQGTVWTGRGDMRMGPGRSEDEVVIAGPEGVVLLDHRSGAIRAEAGAYNGIATPPSVGPGGLLFTGNWKGRAGALRSLAGGETLLEVEGEHVVGQISPDGALLVAGTGREFICYDTASAREIWRLKRDNTDALAGPVAFSGDGALLAVGRSRFMLDLVSPATGDRIASIESPRHQALTSVVLSEDGGLLAMVTSGNLLQVIDLRRVRRQLAELGLDWERPEESPRQL